MRLSRNALTNLSREQQHRRSFAGEETEMEGDQYPSHRANRQEGLDTVDGAPTRVYEEYTTDTGTVEYRLKQPSETDAAGEVAKTTAVGGSAVEEQLALQSYDAEFNFEDDEAQPFPTHTQPEFGGNARDGSFVPNDVFDEEVGSSSLDKEPDSFSRMNVGDEKGGDGDDAISEELPFDSSGDVDVRVSISASRSGSRVETRGGDRGPATPSGAQLVKMDSVPSGFGNEVTPTGRSQNNAAAAPRRKTGMYLHHHRTEKHIGSMWYRMGDCALCMFYIQILTILFFRFPPFPIRLSSFPFLVLPFSISCSGPKRDETRSSKHLQEEATKAKGKGQGVR